MTDYRSNRNQAGIALISVLLAIVGVFIIGVGTLMLSNSNLMISGNLVSSSVARANADAGMDATIAVMAAQFAVNGQLPLANDAPATFFESGGVQYRFASTPEWNGDQVLLRIEGLGPRNARHVSEALVEFAATASGGGTTPYTGVVIGCEAVLTLGSGRIDSYDSRIAPYNSNNPGRSADVHTVSPGAVVRLEGNAPILGNVYSTGAVRATGSSPVLGDIYANGLVEITASTTYGGGIFTTGNISITNTARFPGHFSANGNITFTNGAVVEGNASAGGNIAFVNSGAQVRGNAMAGGTISLTSWATNVLGMRMEGSSPVPNQPVPADECDPLDVRNAVAGIGSSPAARAINTSRPNKDWTIRPDGVSIAYTTGNDSARIAPGVYTQETGNLFGSQVSFYRVSGFNITSDGSVRISGGDVVMFVEGDVTFDGNTHLTIDDDSSLTLIVTGRVSIAASSRVNASAPVNSRGAPTLAIYSTHVQAGSSVDQPWSGNAGVQIGGSSPATATVYAPYSGVVIDGSGALFGSVRGREVVVRGSGGVHYDLALGDVSVGGGGAVDGSVGVRIISRR